MPVGNGDDPTVGQLNRIYARVRNIGTTPAANVVVNYRPHRPRGQGHQRLQRLHHARHRHVGTVPGLLNIPVGGYVDVWVPYTPSFTPTPEQIAAGTFYFHTCVRVRIDTVASETVLGNQDGVDEQENIDYFQAVQPSSPGAAKYSDIIKLHNDDALNPKFFQLSYTSNLPPGWTLDINGGNLGVQMSPNEIRDIPITITPGGGPDPAPGTTYAVEVLAQFQRDMVNTTDPTLTLLNKKHFEFKPLGGVRVEAKVMLPTKITCEAQRQLSVTGGPQVVVKGILIGLDKYDFRNPPRVMIEGVQSAQPTYLTNSLRVLSVPPERPVHRRAGERPVQPNRRDLPVRRDRHARLVGGRPGADRRRPAADHRLDDAGRRRGLDRPRQVQHPLPSRRLQQPAEPDVHADLLSDRRAAERRRLAGLLHAGRDREQPAGDPVRQAVHDGDQLQR